MHRRAALRLLIASAVALAMIAVGALWMLHRVSRAWSERDVTLRAELAVSSARSALVRRWHDPRLKDTLEDIALDERIVGAAACSEDGASIAETKGFPGEFRCVEQLDRTHSRKTSPGTRWTVVQPHGAQTLHATAVTVAAPESRLGFVILIHDLGFAAHREVVAREFLIGLFALFAVGIVALSRVIGRTTDRYSAERLRSSLKRGVVPGELRAVLEDVRAEVEEWSGEPRSGSWSRARLRRTLATPSRDRELVIVTKRAPPSTGDHADGLASMFDILLGACSGIWMTLGESANHALSRNRSTPLGSYVTKYVGVPRSEARGHAHFATRGLGALCQQGGTVPEFTSENFSRYVAVNDKFVESLCGAVRTDDPVVIVDDHSFALLPRLLKARLPRATVVMLWRDRWPPAAVFDTCPHARPIIRGVLAASAVSLRSGSDRENFFDTVERLTKAVSDGKHEAVIQSSGRTLVRSYRTPMEWSERPLSPWRAEECRRTVLKALGIRRSDVALCVQIDTSSKSNRMAKSLLAVERLLERFPEFRGKFVLALLTPPTPDAASNWSDFSKLADRLNERFGRGGQRPIVFFPVPAEFSDRIAYYRAADLCWVSNPSTGIDATAREFLLARDDELGVLVLGRFVDEGASCPGSLPIDLYDPEQASDRLATALRLAPEEQRARMRAARRHAAESNAYRWLGTMLSDLLGSSTGDAPSAPTTAASPEAARAESAEHGSGPQA